MPPTFFLLNATSLWRDIIMVMISTCLALQSKQPPTNWKCYFKRGVVGFTLLDKHNMHQLALSIKVYYQEALNIERHGRNFRRQDLSKQKRIIKRVKWTKVHFLIQTLNQMWWESSRQPRVLWEMMAIKKLHRVYLHESP